VDSSHRESLKWRRSRRCNGGGCVEVAELDSVIMIRDSAESGRAPIVVSHDVWQDFVCWLRLAPSEYTERPRPRLDSDRT
jgi:hypothetical protein